MCNGDFVIHIVQDARQRCERASPDLRGRGNKEMAQYNTQQRIENAEWKYLNTAQDKQ